MVILEGCTLTHNYKPSVYPISPKLITTQFKSNSTVSVINVAPENGVVMLFWKEQGTTHTYYGDLQKITETAVSILSEELSKRGMNVSNSGDDRSKTLKLKVTNVSIDLIFAPWYLNFLIEAIAFPYAGMGKQHGIKYEANVQLDVETGNGYKCEYSVTNSGFTISTTCDRSISRVIAKVFNDPIIIDYLK